ncbi:MAG: hypothetical protein ACI8RN_000573 [Glaciecola sp.]|jgi:hypothetical protein
MGRAVTGVYNKVMSFRHIDPRDERAGMSGGGDMVREVWARQGKAQRPALGRPSVLIDLIQSGGMNDIS